MSEVLYGLAYFAAWIGNFLVYVLIAGIVWMLGALFIEFKLPISEPRRNKVNNVFTITVLALFALAVFGFFFGWPSIIPAPRMS